METVMVQVQIPKEAEAVRELIVGLLGDILAKKDVSVVIADAVPKLISVIGGIQSLSEEVQSAAMVDAIALLVGDIVKIVAKK